MATSAFVPGTQAEICGTGVACNGSNAGEVFGVVAIGPVWYFYSHQVGEGLQQIPSLQGKVSLMGRVALVVDDSMLVRHTVCRFLEERGFVVESATNGREALDLLSNLRPDFIFTDLQMPMMSGSELISAVRARPDMASIPIVVIAGKKGASNSEPEIRSDFVIYKDIDIVQQLERAITALTQSPVASCQSPVKPKTS